MSGCVLSGGTVSRLFLVVKRVHVYSRSSSSMSQPRGLVRCAATASAISLARRSASAVGMTPWFVGFCRSRRRVDGCRRVP